MRYEKFTIKMVRIYAKTIVNRLEDGLFSSMTRYIILIPLVLLFAVMLLFALAMLGMVSGVQIDNFFQPWQSTFPALTAQANTHFATA